MAYFSPERAFEEVKNRTVDAVKGYFPLEGSVNKLVAKKVWVDDDKHIDDLGSQLDARLKGRTWAVPIKAQMELVDKATGKVKDSKTVTVGTIPKITRRYSYIVGGTEWQLANQFRLKSGVYNHILNNGNIAGQWNLATGRGFTMELDPASKKLALKYGNSHVNLYPVLKTMGIADDDIEREWGKEVLGANITEKEDVHLRKMYKTIMGKAPASLEEAKSKIIEELSKTTLRPDSTKLTLGKPFGTVSGLALLTGSNRLLKLSRQEIKPDDRDSLEFKDLLSAEDLIEEKVSKDSRSEITRRLRNTLDKKETVAEIITPATFGRPIRELFTSSTLSERPDQHNPLAFLIGARKTTIMGVHGIDDEQKINIEAQAINPSHPGFIDPIHSPESKRIGAVIQLSSAAVKNGTNLSIPVHNLKTGKDENISPAQALHSNLAFPDQFRKDGKKYIPRDKTVKITDLEGDITLVSPKEVDYVIKSAKGMFDITANTIPFLQNNQGNRTMMATRQLEQAVPLVDREAPLVQVKGEKEKTFEDAVGALNAHHSPVDGTVESIERGKIVVKSGRERHVVHTYDDFPLNDNLSLINSTPTVAVGDKVKKGQLVADSSFTKDGVLALGTNLQVAYMPWKGLNFEDGVVISDSASRKLTSEHMHRFGVKTTDRTILDKKRFTAETAGKWSKEQVAKLDDDSVIKPGTEVKSGDILIGELRKEDLTNEQKQLALFSRKALKPIRDVSRTWDKDYPGVVSRVVKHGRDVTVYVKTKTPAEVGDKLVGRHANKGIIAAVIPDNEMPQTKDGKSMEILLNPAGIPGRINLGQVLETTTGKIAEKGGKTYIVNNFDSSISDYTEHVKKELKDNDISDTEDLKNPTTGDTYKNVLTGPQYILKLHHTAEKKLVARSGGPGRGYTNELQPHGGGEDSGQTMDSGGLYALLAHGARANIRDAQTLKSDMNDLLWERLQTGGPIPTPQVPFVYKKFEAYLRGAGIDIKKDGNTMVLQPLTDKGVLRLSNGKLRDPTRGVSAKDATPEEGGLFDPEMTGTTWPKGKLGDKWTHIELKESMPNPVFEKPISALLGFSQKDLPEIVAGRKQLNGKTGTAAIIDELKKIDVEKDLKELEGKAVTMRGEKLNNTNKKIKYLRALRAAGLTPRDAYTMRYVPVMPPNMRPIGLQPNGDLREADVNGILRLGVAATNFQLHTADPSLPDEDVNELKEGLYDSLKALSLTGMTHKRRYHSGIIDQISSGGVANKPKEGFFQNKVIGKRQDMSMRGTIVPNPALNLDEVGLPRKAAEEIYKPFVVSRLVRMGMTPMQAQDEVKRSTDTARRALDVEVRERPVLLKRDPVLHKYGVQAFMPRLTESKTIEIHPLVTGGFNADFDGDAMSAFVPLSTDAVREAFKMVPSNNLFSPSTGDIAFKPKHEALLGLYNISRIGSKKQVSFDSAADAARAVKEGRITKTDSIRIKNMDGVDDMTKTGAERKPVDTTVGRLLLYSSLPVESRNNRLLSDPDYVLDSKRLPELLRTVAKNNKSDYARVADQLKDMGNFYATGSSVGLDDFTADKGNRDKVLLAARAKEEVIRKDKRLNKDQRNAAVIALYSKAFNSIDDTAKAKFDKKGGRLWDWVKSGARGDWSQFKQMNLAPGLVIDCQNKVVPVPITKSYSEGLDVGGYWTAMHGARMGTIGRVLGTEKPGALFKGMARSSMNQLVVSDDCGTPKGVAMDVDDINTVDRYTAKEVYLGTKGGKEKGVVSAGTLVTPELLSRLKNNKIKEVVVRTPLKCSHGDGVCSMCMGLNEDGLPFDKGTNVGIIASHALGEPLTQMAMSSFHTGGVVGGSGSKAVDKFSRVEQLTKLPATLPGSATLARHEGAVERIETDTTGGWNVYVGGEKHYVPGRLSLEVEVGSPVKKGDSLSSGPKNPKELLPLAGVGAVQRYLTDEIEKVYGNPSPLHQRNTELFVRAVTNLSIVRDPGSNKEVMSGDYKSRSEVEAYNSKLRKGQAPIVHEPVLRGYDMLPLDMHEDWLARMQATRLRDTLLDGVAKGWRTEIHSTHPIPSMAMGAEFGRGTPEAPWLY